METDPEFIKRVLAEIDAQGATAPETPAKVQIDTADLMRLIKVYAGLPISAMRVN